MSIRRTDGPKPVTVRPTTTESQPKNTVKAGAAKPLVVQDGFGPSPRRTELARAEQTLTPVPPKPGRLPLASKDAQTAIQTSLAYVAPQTKSLTKQPDSFVPKNVERDELGMTHVRLDRVHEGVKVFGEQIISHLDKDGKVTSITGETPDIPAGLGSEKPKLSASQAIDAARKEFGAKPDKQPNAERVIYRDTNGQYKSAYRVEMDQIAGQEKPRRMNYLVDANTGKVLNRYNEIDGFSVSKKGATAAATTPTTPETSATATPKATIGDLGTVTSKLKLDGDVTIDKLKLDLDIKHTYRGDLTVTLTSPSGKSAVVHNRTGGSADDVKGSFDLTAFAGEKAKGEWTLTVSDKARGDTGVLNSWGLKATGKPQTTPPPTPTPTPSGTADDTSMYSGKVALNTNKNADGTFSLHDSTRGKGVVTYDGQNKAQASGTVDFKDKNDVWGEAGDDARSKAAVDAHYGAAMTYDMIKNVLGRDSLDGAGEKLVSYVHVDKNLVNAFWDGEKMSYGDGDGKDAGPLTALDIAGHEIAHGLTERTAGLVYSGESGGLNEAMSDIMGAGVEWYASQKNPDVKFNWTVGETAWTPGNGNADGLRYMNDPTKDGYSIDNYKNYPKQTEVHGSSGIANNAFYLLANGGKNRTSGLEVKDGIGMEKGLKIYYRALAHYMTPNTTFKQAREATIKAATDLYGANSTELQKVKDSWTAVGVS
ncbi:M4 family metallopeptidase [Pyxidicoccus parkwayensis]|uniref:M4 family metallopeptidase n=1 Tax=Pyxidicoccus parkwayensis TaxID=2813578 RepID=A0ABX7PB44_9BACT|nr:M4 family metallopeptidase [Pyxidicoccus parkwaysis]QSQ27700.1 M4 family metallopeptidase [Pyxidicoccus parkwaysis]